MNRWAALLCFGAVLMGSLLLDASTRAGEPAVLVRYGTFNGECLAYCSRSIEVSSTRVLFTATVSSPTISVAPFSSEIAMNQDDVAQLRLLLASTTANGLPDRIGCPDCDDSGAEWVEVNSGGPVRRITFEFGKSPAQLKPLVDWLSAMQRRFQVPSLR